MKRNRTDIASEIFTNEYRRGNFYSYDSSRILKYLDTYEAIWEILRQKVPHLTLEISFEDILSEPLETIKKIRLETGKEVKPLQNKLNEMEARQHTLTTADKTDMNAINKNIEEMGKIKIEIAKIQAKQQHGKK